MIRRPCMRWYRVQGRLLFARKEILCKLPLHVSRQQSGRLPFILPGNRRKRGEKMFTLHADKNRLTVRQRETLTSGSINVNTMQFVFSEDWEGLTRTAVFRYGDKLVSIFLDEGGQCRIPGEVLEHPGRHLLAGVYGILGETVVLPTVWADLGVVLERKARGGIRTARGGAVGAGAGREGRRAALHRERGAGPVRRGQVAGVRACDGRRLPAKGRAWPEAGGRDAGRADRRPVRGRHDPAGNGGRRQYGGRKRRSFTWNNLRRKNCEYCS